MHLEGTHLAASAVVLIVACSDPAEAPVVPGGASGGSTGVGGGAGVTTGGGPAAGGQQGIGGGAAQPVTPTATGDAYTFAVATVSFTVNAATGARVTSLSAGGTELLAGAAVNATNYGSTFWTSPQSAWSWPPPAAIDSSPYAASIDGDTVVMVGGSDPALGLAVDKAFAADAASGWIQLSYTVRNTGAATVSVAPWEITRVPTGGLAFFPLGSGGVASNSTLTVSQLGGELWFDSAAQGAQDQKLFADGAGGWSAHAAQGYLFVKRFPDVPAGAAAGGEAEIEIYSGAGYVELEVQGALTSLAAGASFTYVTEWKVVSIPTEVSVEAGSAALVALAAEVAAG